MIQPNSYSFETALKGDPKVLSTIPKSSNIEFPCFETSKLNELFALCDELGLTYSLHYPSYYSYNKVGFNASDDYRKILSDIEEYRGRFSGINYFLRHFPFQSFTAVTIPNLVLRDIIRSLSDMSDDKFPFLIENISIVTNCSSAEQYADYLSETNLKFCLDIGHAHLVNSTEPFNFCNLLRDKILALHYYNTPNRDHKKIGYHFHYNDSSISGDERFINLSSLSESINRLTNLKWIVDESYDRT